MNKEKLIKKDFLYVDNYPILSKRLLYMGKYAKT